MVVQNWQLVNLNKDTHNKFTNSPALLIPKYVSIYVNNKPVSEKVAFLPKVMN